VYLRMYFTNPNGDVQGFGFRGANGAGWAEEHHSFANPSFGQVGPGWIEYPFNLGCGTDREIGTDVQAWIYNNSGKRSQSITVHLTCAN
jgi:hypothetical protein